MNEEHPNRMGAPGGPSNPHAHEAWVGTCGAVDCEYNSNSHCHAPNIRIVKHETHADCGTYDPRSQKA